MGWNQRYKCNFILFDNCQNFFGFKANCRVDIGRAADIQEGKSKKYGINVAKRHHIQADIFLGEAKIHGTVQVISNVRFMRT